MKAKIKRKIIRIAVELAMTTLITALLSISVILLGGEIESIGLLIAARVAGAALFFATLRVTNFIYSQGWLPITARLTNV